MPFILFWGVGAIFHVQLDYLVKVNTHYSIVHSYSDASVEDVLYAFICPTGSIFFYNYVDLLSFYERFSRTCHDSITNGR